MPPGCITAGRCHLRSLSGVGSVSGIILTMELEVRGENLFHGHFVHSTSHVYLPGIEPEPQR